MSITNTPVPLERSQSPNGTNSKMFDLKQQFVNGTAQPAVLPMPESTQKLHLLLARFRELETNGGSQADKLAIEYLFKRISKQQDKYIADLNSFYSSVKPDGDLDLDLLREQVVGLQLLSKDLDLPTYLQSDFASEYQDSEDSKIEYPIALPLEDHKQRAKLLGLQPDLKKADPVVHAVSNPQNEEIVVKKIANRIIELENLPNNLGTFDVNNLENITNPSDKPLLGVDDLKVRALIELKSLRLLYKQKHLKRSLLSQQFASSHSSIDYLAKNHTRLAATRSVHTRPKIRAPQTARLAEQLEEQQKKEKKRLEMNLQLRKSEKILEGVSQFLEIRSEKATQRSNLGRVMGNLHSYIEKDESKKLEKTAKQRLQALKANDEEAYLKLLDQTKDTRITHLLKQTNSFLDSLANAVKAQQNESQVVNQAPQIENENPDATREKVDYYEVAHRIKEGVKQPSILIGGTLKEYQVKGLEWMVSLYNNHLNGILADEMGLGKTIQSISLIAYLIEYKQEYGKFLVIVPLSTITNWTMEFEKWAPSIRTIVYKGAQSQRKMLQYDIRSGNFTVLLTTYEYVIKDRPLLCKFKWAHMIIDEGHRMKNSKSKLSYTLTNYYHTRNRLILTGTPLQNNLPELWALLNFVLPKIFNSVKSFDEWFNTPFANTGTQDKMELTEEESLLVIRRLHKVLRPFLLRRLKKDVEKDLPDKVEKVIKCKFSSLQAALYQQMLKHNALFIGASSGPGVSKSGIKGLNNKIMQLRKICNHPFVFDEVENVVDPTRSTADLIWRTSAKFELLDRVLPKFCATGHRVLIFFQMTQVMDIMEDYLRYREMKYLRLDGSTNADDRQDMLKAFNAPDSEYFCFLLSTRAGGLGLNLQTADTVIIFDTDWNPHQDLQAQDRAHRIGQKNEVRILRLITTDSVEEVILERAHQKLDIDGKVIQAGKFDNKSTSEEQEAFLKRLIEAEQLKREGNAESDDEMEDDELNEILARSEDEKILFDKMDTDRLAKARMDGQTHPRLFSDEELPQVFKEDVGKHLEQPTFELGRTREKKRVMYDDGLTEEQWLEAMDDDDDSVEDAIRRKKDSLARRRAKRGLGDAEDDDLEVSFHEGVNDTDIIDGEEEQPVTKKRKGKKTKKSLPNFTDKALSLIEGIKSLKPEDEDRHRVDLFLNLPNKQQYPDYYQLIRQPVCVTGLEKKLKDGDFDTYDSFIQELRTMFTNAKLYNEEGSWVHQDAVEMENYVDQNI
ncbi:hypothetical protein LJB42_004330 [Komagataella kurtzmanii]|nr:hypothetical protein LJB42_004330 [Komagataella kurtzmanii]